jgi:PAS domain-containing protein
MDETSFTTGNPYDPRLAAHAVGAAPVWLWSPDGRCVLWANPAGCAAFGAATLGGLASRTFAPDAAVRVQVARLAATLPQNGASRLQRLRGFVNQGPHLWRPLVCSCTLFRLDRIAGVLVVAIEAAGPALSLAEQVRRLDLDAGTAFAAFAPGGDLLFATPEGQRRLGGAATIAAIGADALAVTAMAAGEACGECTIGPMMLRRIGDGASTVLLARFEPAATAPDVATPAPSAPRTADWSERCPDATPSYAPEIPLPRYPLRFVWQMDPSGRFTLGTDAFAEIIGTRSAIALGRPWQEINAELGLDPAGNFAAAVRTQESWSNITVSWPIDDSDERLDVELTGLPAFDRNRIFVGYRGFGICRDIDRIDNLRSMRRIALLAPASPMIDESAPKPQSHDAAVHRDDGNGSQLVAPNVVPFPIPTGFGEAKPGAEHKLPALSPGEHVTFRELTRQLTERLQDGETSQAAAQVWDHGKTSQSVPVAARIAAATDASEHAAVWSLNDTHPALDDHALLNRLPIGILVYRIDELLLANRALLDMTGYADIGALSSAGGLDALLTEADTEALADGGENGKRIAIATQSGNRLPVEGRLVAVRWNREPAFALVLSKSETNGHIQTAGKALSVAAAEPANIEAGKFPRTPSAFDLNAVVKSCVAQMQPDANEGHVIVRTSLSPAAHKVTADSGAVRKMVSDLLGHAIKGSRPGGQVIVSTGISPGGDVVLRLRHNGYGLSDQSIAAARQPAAPQGTSPHFSFAGQSPPLNRAMTEANHARFKIASLPHEGLLFELTFAGKPEIAD